MSSTAAAAPAPLDAVMQIASGYIWSAAPYATTKMGIPDLLQNGPRTTEDRPGHELQRRRAVPHIDLQYVVAGAGSGIENLGLGKRCTTASGDFFKAGPAVDAYFMKSILHDWDDERGWPFCNAAAAVDRRMPRSSWWRPLLLRATNRTWPSGSIW